MAVNVKEPPTLFGRGFFVLRVNGLLTVTQFVFLVLCIVPGEAVSLLSGSNR